MSKVEDWINGKEVKEEVPLKRLTIPIPEELHRRIKVKCVSNGNNMAEVVSKILEREFPAEKSKS